MGVKEDMRDIFLFDEMNRDKNIFLLKGWLGEHPILTKNNEERPVKEILDFSDGVPSYTPHIKRNLDEDELPKVHVSFETATSFEDTSSLEKVLVTTQMVIRLYIRYRAATNPMIKERMEKVSDQGINAQLRVFLEDYSLELSRNLRMSPVYRVKNLISLYLVQTKYEIDGEADPRVGILSHRYVMRYRL